MNATNGDAMQTANWNPVNVACVRIGMQVVERDGALLEVVDVQPAGRRDYTLTLRSMMGDIKTRIRAGKMLKVLPSR